MIFNIKRRKFNVKGKLAWEYNALRNLEKIENNEVVLGDFNTGNLTLDINHPVDIECQPSYDGSTNLILNDDYNVPRIVNSAFSLTEDNSYERVSRNQTVKTNIYKESSLDSETRLQRTTSSFLKIHLKELSAGGSLAGGNYVFLAQYSDDDDNKTSVVAESGIVSVFNGNYQHPSTIQGTLLHERTDKQLCLEFSNLDISFSKIYISYRRDYCDLNGVKQVEYKRIEQPYEIHEGSMEIIIDGAENTLDTTFDELTASRNMYAKVKTHAQNQNILFFGNVEETYDQIKLLQSLALYIQVQPVWGESVGYLNENNFKGYGKEYFNPNNIYNNIGYMPEEYYRLGVVFIYNDDSKSSVYNLRGCIFENMYEWNHVDKAPSKDSNININDLFIPESSVGTNTKGVFRMPCVDLFATNNISTIALNFKIPSYVLTTLKTLNIKGYYFVRQARIPVFLTQGFSVGVSNNAYVPLLSTVTGEGSDKQPCFRVDGTICRVNTANINTINENGESIRISGYNSQYTDTGTVKFRGLVCPDVILNPQLQSLLSGTTFKLKEVGDYNSYGLFEELKDSEDSSKTSFISGNKKKVVLYRTSRDVQKEIERELIYIPENSSFRSYKNYTFSTKAGSSVDVKSLRSVEDKDSFYLNQYCVRGNYIPFVGVVDGTIENNSSTLEPNCVYNVYTSEYGTDSMLIQTAIKKRAYNYSEYTAICDPINVFGSDGMILAQEIACARGDCFTCTTQHRFTYNFLDNNAPLQEVQVKDIIKKGKSKKNQPADIVNELFDKKVDEITASAWLEFNTSDVNSVDFGFYISAKYMSNFNHNIRAVDTRNVDEISLYGSPRQFLPFGGDVVGVAFKIPESTLHNSGLSTTRTVMPHFEAVQVPYINNHFDTRIAFSNIASTRSFANGFRVFSGVSYQDIERTYGSIVKLIPLGTNLFCVFEHGCGIVPVNEKALMSTTTGQSIHLYGAGVLQEQVTVVSQDYGSTWEDSIVVTPNGIYGVDTWAKKIWRYNANGFELISDQLVQRFLNDNVTMTESDWIPTVALKNVKSHFNGYKGDIMFTFYKGNTCWNLCYNERINKFVTKYSWFPLLSDNIQNSFVSIDRDAVQPLALIAENQVLDRGVVLDEDDSTRYSFEYKKNWEQCSAVNVGDGETDTIPIVENTCKFNRTFSLKGYEPCNALMVHIRSVSVSAWDEANHKEIVNTYTNDTEHGFWIDPHKVKLDVELEMDDENDEQTSLQEGVIETPSKYKVSVVGWDKKSNPIDDSKLFSYLNEGRYQMDSESYYLDSYDGNPTGDELDEIEYRNFKSQWKNYVACTSGTHMGVEVQLDKYVNWIKVDLSVSPMLTTLTGETGGFKTREYNYQGDPFTQSICFVANYDHLANNTDNEYEDYLTQWEKTLRVGLYTHGRAGIYDEINYFDDNPNNNIKPAFWYNKQEPFEFEFVVNTPTGVQKIFDNLVLISNNAEPESLEISLVGDAYNFNKAGIFKATNTTIPNDPETGILDLAAQEQAKLNAEFEFTNRSQEFDIKVGDVHFNTTVHRDPVLNQHYLTVHDDCRNVKRWGKRLGNIEYREDRWLVTLSPIIFKNTEAIEDSNNNSTIVATSSLNSAKLRDKWCKVRVKYKGDKLVVISAIQTLSTISYS